MTEPMGPNDEPAASEELVSEEKEAELEFDSKGNNLTYEASAYARPRTRGRMPKNNELNDRNSGHT